MFSFISTASRIIFQMRQLQFISSPLRTQIPPMVWYKILDRKREQPETLNVSCLASCLRPDIFRSKFPPRFNLQNQDLEFISLIRADMMYLHPTPAAFCAIIHNNRSDLLPNPNTLSSSDPLKNLNLGMYFPDVRIA
jgi:hypothetical protein